MYSEEILPFFGPHTHVVGLLHFNHDDVFLLLHPFASICPHPHRVSNKTFPAFSIVTWKDITRINNLWWQYFRHNRFSNDCL